MKYTELLKEFDGQGSLVHWQIKNISSSSPRNTVTDRPLTYDEVCISDLAYGLSRLVEALSTPDTSVPIATGTRVTLHEHALWAFEEALKAFGVDAERR